MTTQLQTVPFNDHVILTIVGEQGVQVVMKPIVDDMGLIWRRQHARIKSHPVLSKGITLNVIPSAGGMQEMLCLDLQSFHGWLLTLDTRYVEDEAKRAMIEAYQARAFRAVFEHFHGPLRIKDTKALSPFELVRVGNLLKKETNRKVRAHLWDRYDQVTDSWGLPRGERIGIGYDAPDYDDILAEFWAAVRGLDELGIAVNQSLRNDVIALNLPDLRAKFLQSEVPIEIGRGLTEALRHSESPRFIAEKTVRCSDGKTRFCWVFNAVAELPLLQ